MSTQESESRRALQVHNASAPSNSLLHQDVPQQMRSSTSTTWSALSSSIDLIEPSPLSLPQQQPRDPGCQRRRVEFALLIKILLKILLEDAEISLYHQVRLSISTCTKRNRMGDPSFSPLEDVLEAHLWLMVGDTYWDRAVSLQQRYLQRKAFQPQRDNAPKLLHPGAPPKESHQVVQL